MDVLEQTSRLATRVKNDNRHATQDWLDRVTDYHSGVIKDDRITCSECKNNMGRCVARGDTGVYMPNLKQRCIKFLKR